MKSWKASISVYRNPKMIVMAVLGFFSGLPLILLLVYQKNHQKVLLV